MGRKGKETVPGSYHYGSYDQDQWRSLDCVSALDEFIRYVVRESQSVLGEDGQPSHMHRYYLPHPEYLRCYAKAYAVLETMEQLKTIAREHEIKTRPDMLLHAYSVINDDLHDPSDLWEGRGQAVNAAKSSLLNSEQGKFAAFELLTWACEEKKVPLMHSQPELDEWYAQAVNAEGKRRGLQCYLCDQTFWVAVNGRAHFESQHPDGAFDFVKLTWHDDDGTARSEANSNDRMDKNR